MTFSIYAGIMQGVVFCAMAFLLPLIMRGHAGAMRRYGCYSFLLWGAYTLVAMTVDVALGSGPPGIGYIIMGGCAWIIGYAIISSYAPQPKTSAPSEPQKIEE